MHQHERTGGEKASEELCWEGAALKMRSCWHGFYIEQLLYKGALQTGALHRGSLHGASFTQGNLYTGRTLYTEFFAQEKFYTQKLLYKEVFLQSSLDAEKLALTEAFAQRSLLHRAAFPECVARVPVSLWGSGAWGCVRSTLRARSQPFATVRNRPRDPRMAVPLGNSAEVVIFGGFQRFVASFSVAGVALCDIQMFSEDILQFSWQVQYFGRVHSYFS